MWWPGISKDIQTKVQSCEFCQINKPTQRKEPLKPTTLPDRPWQKIAADLCELNRKHYLVVTDYYSRYIEIAYLEQLTSEYVVGKMKNIFARWGIPEEMISDNGTQFNSDTFRQFAVKYGFRQTFSSPHYPQSNGEAESAVKIAKRLLRQDDVFTAIMEYRATPIEATGLSPAEMMMGRKIRTLLPTLPKLLKPDWIERDDMRLRDQRYKERARDGYDRRNGTTPLSVLDRGDTVRIKTDSQKSWSTDKGVVRDRDRDRRSYTVETRRGTYRRNRRHLQAIPFEQPDAKSSDLTLDFDIPNPVEAVPTVVNDSHIVSSSNNCDKPPVVTRSGRVVKPKTYEDFVT